MNHYTNILFDLDGTLIDSKHGVLSCVKKTFADLNFSLPPENRLDGFMGPPLEYCFTQVCGLNWEQASQAIKVYRRYYEGGGIYDAKVYSGMTQLLKELKSAGCRLGVATSKSQRFAVIVLKHCGILDYFDTVAGAPDNIEVKWLKKDSVEKAMGELAGANKHNTVLVGDRVFDAQGAKEAEIDSIGVLFGYGTKAELEASPFKVIAVDIKSLSELL
jgi:phosphoglycolate phosphatase